MGWVSAFVLVGAACNSPSSRVAFVGATVLGGDGFEPLPNAVLIVESGRVACVGSPAGCEVRRADSVIDLTGRWIIPGLVDFHTHVAEYAWLPYGPLYLAHGITTVRDVGGRTDSSLVLRERWRVSGLGPNLFIAGGVTRFRLL